MESTYIALLRGINVSGSNIIKMADLRDMMENLGFSGAETYIQSGNIIFRSETSDLNTLEERIVSGIAARFYLSVPALVLDSKHLTAILRSCPFPDDGISKPVGVYISFMFAPPDDECIPAIDGRTAPTERWTIIDSCLFLNCPAGYGKTGITNEFIEKKLKVVSTTRNIRTVRKLAVIAESLDAPGH
jgi:uncharacterized protein (DUF1697 family)